MLIGDRIRAIRERKQLSQIELAVRAGLVRSYISGVENGYIVPSVETMEKIAQVLDVPLHKFFYDGDEPPFLRNLPNRSTAADIALGVGCKSRDCFLEFGQQVDSHGYKESLAGFTTTEMISISSLGRHASEAHDSIMDNNIHRKLISGGFLF